MLLTQGKTLSFLGVFFSHSKPNQSTEKRDISDLWVSENTSTA